MYHEQCALGNQIGAVLFVDKLEIYTCNVSPIVYLLLLLFLMLLYSVTVIAS